MVDNGNGAGQAFDATVEVRPENNVAKARAAVDYYERELAAITEGIERLQAKHEKFEAHVSEVEQELEDANNERDRLEDALDEARALAEELAAPTVTTTEVNG